jgi:hypothetical protein
MAAARALPVLIYLNESEQLCSAGKQGFYDRRYKPPKRLCGVYTFLHKKTRVFPTVSKIQYLANREHRQQRGQKSSSKRGGAYCHVQVQHSLLCVPTGTCRCDKRGVVRKQSPAFDMVKAAQQFISDKQLVPVTGELVISSPVIGLATKFDLLCSCPTGGYTLVSWKTTGSCPFPPAAQQVSAEELICRGVPGEDTSSERRSAREHVGQLVAELHMLKDLHKVDVREAYVAYLQPFQTSYRCIRLCPQTMTGGGYQRTWQWIVAHKTND